MQETKSSIPGSGRSPEEENGNSFQYSGVGEAWWATVHGISKELDTSECSTTTLLLKLLDLCLSALFEYGLLLYDLMFKDIYWKC